MPKQQRHNHISKLGIVTCLLSNLTEMSIFNAEKKDSNVWCWQFGKVLYQLIHKELTLGEGLFAFAQIKFERKKK
jgi:hypothetical protein